MKNTYSVILVIAALLAAFVIGVVYGTQGTPAADKSISSAHTSQKSGEDAGGVTGASADTPILPQEMNSNTQKNVIAIPAAQSVNSVVTAVVAKDKTKVTMAMSDGKILTLATGDIHDHDMKFTDETGLRWTCPVAFISDAKSITSQPGKVLLTVGSALCPADSDFTSTVLIDPYTKKQLVVANGLLIGVSKDESCILSAASPGGRGGGVPAYYVNNMQSGAELGHFQTWQPGSELRNAFTEVARTAGAVFPLVEGDAFESSYVASGFEGDTCRVVMTITDTARYGGAWIFSVNVWGKNPRLIKRPH